MTAIEWTMRKSALCTASIGTGLVFLLLTAPAIAQAADGIFMTQRVTTGGAPLTTIQVQIEPSRMRTEMAGPDGITNVTIFDGGKQVLYIIDPARKTYMEMTKADVDRMSAQMKGSVAQMQAQLEKMPPAQRAQMEAMMKGVQFTRTGSDTVGRWTCDKYDLTTGGQKTGEVCMVNPAALGFTAADFAVMGQMGAFYSTTASLMPNLLPGVAGIKMATLDSVMTYQDVARLIGEEFPDTLLITGEDRFLGYSMLGGAQGALIGMGAALPALQAELVSHHPAEHPARFLHRTVAVDRFAGATFRAPMEGYIRRMLWALSDTGVIPEEATFDPEGPSLAAWERAGTLARLGSAVGPIEKSFGTMRSSGVRSWIDPCPRARRDSSMPSCRIWRTWRTPSSPAAARPHRNARPISTALAPSASALTTSLPRRTPPSSTTSIWSPTASTTAGSIRMEAGTPSTLFPPWLDTEIAVAPRSTARLASSGRRMPLIMKGPCQTLRSHCRSAPVGCGVCDHVAYAS